MGACRRPRCSRSWPGSDWRASPWATGSSRARSKPYSTMPEAAIRLSGVTKRYRLYGSVAERALDVLGLSALRPRRPPSYAEHTAIDGVDLEIGRGERVGI